MAVLSLLVSSAALLWGAARAADSDVVVLTNDNFDASLSEAGGTWFVEFYAPWCGHCKKLAPTWEEVATELKGDVSTAKVDATQEKTLAQRFGVRGYPTLLLMKDGKYQKYSGARSKDALAKFARTASPSDDMPKPGEKAATPDKGGRKGGKGGLEDLLNANKKKSKEEREAERKKKMAEAKKEVTEELIKSNVLFATAVNNNNAEEFAAAFTEDSVVLMGGAEPFEGPQGLQALSEFFGKQGYTKLSLDSAAVELPDFMFKKTALQRGTYGLSRGMTQAVSGNFLAYYEKKDKDSPWKIKTLMFADDGKQADSGGAKKEL